jgi:hypothetical protein
MNFKLNLKNLRLRLRVVASILEQLRQPTGGPSFLAGDLDGSASAGGLGSGFGCEVILDHPPAAAGAVTGTVCSCFELDDRYIHHDHEAGGLMFTRSTRE